MKDYMFRKNHKLKLGVQAIIAATIVIVMLGAVMVYRNAAIRNDITIATTHQPEPYTELYFIDPAHLPKTVSPGVLQKFTFHLTNNEGAATTYTYRLSVGDSTSVTILQSQTLRLNNSSGKDVSVMFSIPISHQLDTISVTLLGRSEHINFRIQS